MSHVKPETRCKHLARDIRPLAEHVTKGYSPSIPRISIRRADWELLLEQPEAARAEGFSVNAQHITFEGIEVIPR